MSRLRIRHETIYRFPHAVTFGLWRLMMRPLDTHATRLLSAGLELTPHGQTRWGLDAYGNCVCLYQPHGSSAELRVVNNLLIERYPVSLDIELDAAAIVDDEVSRALVLSPYWIPAVIETGPAFREWLAGHAPAAGEDRLAYVRRLNSALHRTIAYQARDAEGVQSPIETLTRAAGACRDIAWLMIETLRHHGYAARFVSGYLYAPSGGVQGAGATHAWCEVFLGGLGWIEFDPTNDLAESRDLIRIAATRTPAEAAPLRGTTLDPAQGQMQVSVEVAPA